jgi:hypothetical protein
MAEPAHNLILIYTKLLTDRELVGLDEYFSTGGDNSLQSTIYKQISLCLNVEGRRTAAKLREGTQFLYTQDTDCLQVKRVISGFWQIILHVCQNSLNQQ